MRRKQWPEPPVDGLESRHAAGEAFLSRPLAPTLDVVEPPPSVDR
jgi:hypothetical protein